MTSRIKKSPQPEIKGKKLDSKKRGATKRRKVAAVNKQASGAAPSPNLEELQTRVMRLADINVRLQAEVQNISRRAALDVEKAHKFGLVSFATALLDTVDNLEKALASFDKKAIPPPVYEGIKLTYQSLVETLKQFNVTAVDPVGEPFNPELHEALGKQPSRYEADTVVTTVQKGYVLNERLLRAAKVFIAE